MSNSNNPNQYQPPPNAGGGAADVEMASQAEVDPQASAVPQTLPPANTGPNAQSAADAEMTNQDVAMAQNLESQRTGQPNNPAQPSSGDIVIPTEDMEDAEQIASGANIQLQERVRISSLPFEEKQKALKAFWETCWSDAKEGEFIDAIDSVQKWCLAHIAERDDTSVRCHFDGWSNKWDVSYRWASYRIAPFRRFSRGYSGQMKIPFRSNMNYTPEWARAQIEAMQRVIDTDFQELSAKYVTQYLRGTMFVNVDFVLSANTIPVENVAEVVELLRSAIRLVVAWLNKVPPLLQKSLRDARAE